MIKVRLTAEEENEYFVYDKYDNRVYIKNLSGTTLKLNVIGILDYINWLNNHVASPVEFFSILGQTNIGIKDVYYVPVGEKEPKRFWDALKETLSDDTIKHQHYQVLNKDSGMWLNYTGKATDITEATALTIWEMLPLISISSDFDFGNTVVNDGIDYVPLKDVIRNMLNKKEWLRVEMLRLSQQ